MPIRLNDVLKLDNLEKVKVRFNLPSGNFDPVERYYDGEESILTAGFWEGAQHQKLRKGETVINVLRLPDDATKWLVFNIAEITEDKRLDYDEADGDVDSHYFHEYRTLEKYREYFGRLVLTFNKKSENQVSWLKTIEDKIEVSQNLPYAFNQCEHFPGFKDIDINWSELRIALKTASWQDALRYQRGVYLITDTKTGKHYVGSAYGKNMLLGRWQAYAKEGYDKHDVEDGGHGGNKKLQELVKKEGLDYVKKNFRYTILETSSSTMTNSEIIARENHWKKILLTRDPNGYNAN